MTRLSLRVVFLGSPSVAVPALQAVSDRFVVPLVVTQPDRPKGRGRRVLPTAVKRRALELGLEVLSAPDANSHDALAAIRAARPDAIVVVSFGQMIRAALRRMVPQGCTNLHFSLLPELRGAAPLPWAIIRGKTVTGVSMMKITRRMDAGPVYATDSTPIAHSDTLDSLSVRLSEMGARLLADTLEEITRGTLQAMPQDEKAATYAPKIGHADAAIDFRRPANQIDCLIRGLSVMRGAYAFLDREKPLRVNFYNCSVVNEPSPGPGVVSRGPAGELRIGCGDGLVEIKEIQAQGKRRLSGRDFANGYHLTPTDVFKNGG